MSQLLGRVKDNVQICAVAISFGANAKPSIIEGWQRFSNSTFENEDFQKLYAGASSLQFLEESVESPAGTYYKQKASFRFPTSDHLRADRLAIFRKVKFLELKLTNGLVLVIGRNDANQNVKPKVTIKTNHQLAEVDIVTSSIFPSGYTPNSSIFGLPTYVPLIL